MTQLFKNNAVSALVGAIAAADTVFVVANGEIFPALVAGEFFLVTLIRLDTNGNETSWEIVKVTARTGNTLTVVRAQEGTSAQAWPDGTLVEARMTAGSLAELRAADASKLGGRAAAEFWHTDNLVKQTNFLDSTPGALMKVGAFGLGSTGSLTGTNGNADEMLTAGWYWLNTAATGKPAGSSSGILFVQPSASAATAAQFFFESRAGTSPQLWWRQKNYSTNSWSPWVYLFHSGNILGTVSQSGGIATGSLFQPVENANGRALIFPDGTAICFKNVIASYATRSEYLDTGPTDWPITFASTNDLSVGHSVSTPPSGVAGNNVGYCRLDKSASSIRAYVYAVAGTVGFSSGNTVEVRITAMGKVAL